MLSLFLSFVSSLWWDFSINEFDQKVNESENHPLVALMYTTWCPLCIGKPEEFKQFYKEYENDDRVTFTLINCEDRAWCFDRGARSIPYFVVIKGNQSEYWKYTNLGGIEKWRELVDDAIEPTVTRIENNNFGKRIIKTMHGASYFHLVIQKDHTQLLKEFQELAEKYRKYGCRFTYKYKTITKPSLRVYRSPFCMYKIKGKIDGFEWFIKTNKYGHMHRYTGDGDMNDINKTKPFALYVIPYAMQQIQFDHFMNLSNTYCKSVDFGYASAVDAKAYEDRTSYRYGDAPFMLVTNFKHNCSIATKKKLLDGSRLGLYTHLANNKTCSSYREGWVRKRDPNAVMFLSLSFIGTGALIALFIEVRRLLISLKVE